MGAREQERAVGEFRGERIGHRSQVGHVRGVQPDRIAVRDERPIGRRPPMRLHRPFDPALQLEGLDPRPKEAGGWPLDESLDESLDGGERSHGAPGV